MYQLVAILNGYYIHQTYSSIYGYRGHCTTYQVRRSTILALPPRFSQLLTFSKERAERAKDSSSAQF